ncbi:MAG: DNA polymerase III subunit gamma/tau [Clostridiales bacterium]|nr:DNA polymerase III subunit gamma/tau [Clostridiales bacterium]
MEHVALYRLYRPMDFDDIVEQAHAVAALRQTVISGKIGHAYLFCGTRGTGKTSIAKVFSRAINCLHPVNGNPCNQCEICKGVIDGSLLDVIEMDAASNNSVDNIRRVCEEVIFMPAKAKYKVYIIDEVHMLSAGAFNALLKTLEEPPAHAVFLLATTEPHRIPATILSRCQRYDFRRITTESIVKRLQYIAEKQNISIEQDALAAIATIGDGALRDSVSLLDQVGTTFEGKTITREDVIKIVGLVDEVFLSRFASALLEGRAADLLPLTRELIMDGRDLVRFTLDLAQYFRNILVTRISPRPQTLIESTASGIAVMTELGKRADSETLLFFISKLSDLVSELKWSPSLRTSFEITMLRLASRGNKIAPAVIPAAPVKAPVPAASAPAPVPAIAKPAPAPVVDKPAPAAPASVATKPAPAPKKELPPIARPLPEKAPEKKEEPEVMAPPPVLDFPNTPVQTAVPDVKPAVAVKPSDTPPVLDDLRSTPASAPSDDTGRSVPNLDDISTPPPSLDDISAPPPSLDDISAPPPELDPDYMAPPPLMDPTPSGMVEQAPSLDDIVPREAAPSAEELARTAPAHPNLHKAFATEYVNEGQHTNLAKAAKGPEVRVPEMPPEVLVPAGKEAASPAPAKVSNLQQVIRHESNTFEQARKNFLDIVMVKSPYDYFNMGDSSILWEDRIVWCILPNSVAPQIEGIRSNAEIMDALLSSCQKFEPALLEAKVVTREEYERTKGPSDSTEIPKSSGQPDWVKAIEKAGQENGIPIDHVTDM